MKRFTKEDMKPLSDVAHLKDEMGQDIEMWQAVNGKWYQRISGEGYSQLLVADERGGPYNDVIIPINHGGARNNAGSKTGINQYTSAKDELNRYGYVTIEAHKKIEKHRNRGPNKRKRKDAGKKRVKRNDSDKLYDLSVNDVVMDVINDTNEVNRLIALEEAKELRNTDEAKLDRQIRHQEAQARYRRRNKTEISKYRAEYRNSPEVKARRRQQSYEAKRKQLPEDLICPCCFAERTAMKQWVKRLGIWICRSCATLINDNVDNIVALQQLVFKRNQERLQR